MLRLTLLRAAIAATVALGTLTTADAKACGTYGAAPISPEEQAVRDAIARHVDARELRRAQRAGRSDAPTLAILDVAMNGKRARADVMLFKGEGSRSEQVFLAHSKHGWRVTFVAPQKARSAAR